MNRVAAVVSSEIVLPKLTPRSIERLRFALSYPHPEYVRSLRTGHGGGGAPIRFECIAEMPDGSVRAPRGTSDVVREALLADDLLPAYEDRRSPGDPAPFACSITQREYGRQAILRLERKTQGVVVLPCGGGKTKIGVGAIAHLGRAAIVLVHTGDLLEQWCQEVRESLGIEPGIVDADRKQLDASVIVVASVFSLAPLLENDPALGARFGTAVIDECHHVPALTLQRVLRCLPAKYRLGLSATPDREDGHGKLIGWTLGPILLRKTAQELVASGFLMMPEVREVRTDFTFEGDEDDRRRLVKMDRALCANEARNRQIVDLALWDAQAGESVLVLSNRKPHCRRLGEMLGAAGCPAQVLLGSTGKRARAAAVEAMKSGDAAVTIATSLADEGLNIERLSRIILAFPERARGRTIQRVGRLMRVWVGKKPVLYDIVDAQVDTLARRAAERRRAYRTLGIVP